jgi:hypothetical protein
MSQREEIVNMEYDVIKDYELADMVKKVNKAIKEGWKLQGGVCVDSFNVRFTWAQAMVREGK